MQLTIHIKDFDNNNIYFCNKTENTVISGGSFYRLMYCTKDFSMLGIHVLFDTEVSLGTTTYQYTFKEIISKISEKVLSVILMITAQIHNKWLLDIDSKNSKPLNPITVYNIEQSVSKAVDTYKNQLKKGVKIPFILKCSGIYETEFETGISFRLNYK